MVHVKHKTACTPSILVLSFQMFSRLIQAWNSNLDQKIMKFVNTHIANWQLFKGSNVLKRRRWDRAVIGLLFKKEIVSSWRLQNLLLLEIYFPFLVHLLQLYDLYTFPAWLLNEHRLRPSVYLCPSTWWHTRRRISNELSLPKYPMHTYVNPMSVLQVFIKTWLASRTPVQSLFTVRHLNRHITSAIKLANIAPAARSHCPM